MTVTTLTLTRGILFASLLAKAGFGYAADLVLVAGATGRTGVYAVEQLVEKGYRVRALVRDADKARAALPATVEIALGDVRDPATLAPAMQGVAYVIAAIGAGGKKSAPGNGPEEVDRQGIMNLVHTAQAAGVRQFVLVSSGATSKADTYPAEFMRPILRAKFASEEYLRASGLPYTVVKPGGLVDVPNEPSRILLSQGDAAPGRVSRVELAQICVAALGSAAARGKTFEVASEPGEPVTDLEPLFAGLTPDKTAAK